MPLDTQNTDPRTRFWNNALDKLAVSLFLSSDSQLGMYFGVSRQFISQLRSGDRNPTPPIVSAIIERCGVTADREFLLNLLSRDMQEAILQVEARQQAEAETPSP